MKKITIVLGMVILVGLLGCGKGGENGEKSIVGKWQQIEAEGETQIIEFLKDKKVLIYDLKDVNRKEEVGLPGDYRFIDKKRIRMNVALFGPIEAEISLSGDEITLTNPFGKIEKYRKLEDGDRLSVESDREIPKRRLSRQETKLLGKYLGQMDDGSQIPLELKQDRIALLGGLTAAWEVIWVPSGNRPYSPTLTLMFYQLSGHSMGLSYHASDGEKAIHIPLDFDSYQVDYWHRRLMDSQEIWAREPGANLITLRKKDVEVWAEDGRTVCPGEVKIWDSYIGKSGNQKTILELKRIPDFKPPGWIRLTGCHGSGSFYSIGDWEISGNKIKINTGGQTAAELEIKRDTLIDKKENITFVKKNDDSSFRISPTKVAPSEKVAPEKETSVLKGNKSRSIYDQGVEDEKRLKAPTGIVSAPVRPTELGVLPTQEFKKLSPEDKAEAQKLWQYVQNQKELSRLPTMTYRQMAKVCREIIRRWPESEYAFLAKKALADIPEQCRKEYDTSQEDIYKPESDTYADKVDSQELVPINIELPKPMFVGTPMDWRSPNLEKPLGKPRPSFLAPPGTKNVASGRPVASSDKEPIIGKVTMITDGDKEGVSYVELGPFLQHVTIDLGFPHQIYAVVVWHYHKGPRVYFDVVVQIADDTNFSKNVMTIFNNDFDNSAGFGVGKDMHYTETYEGKLIDCMPGVRGQYVRLYSNGNNYNDLNHYVEAEVFGRLSYPEKDKVIKEISEANIPGKYILEKIDSQGNVLAREFGVMNFQGDGSIIGSYSGRWVVQGEQINFFEGSKRVGSGKLLAGAIANWQVEDVPSWQAERIPKKTGAEMLRKISEWIIVWSEYFSPGNQSFSLKLQKDATFSMSGLLEEKWKIENGAIQIYKGEKKTDFKDGQIEGENIIFKLEDGLVRLTRQN